MLAHYLKIAWRHLWRNKSSSFINLLGLATGVASCLLIFLYIQNEKSYDRHFSKSDRIYRLARERQYPNRLVRYAQVGHSWGPTIQDEIPEVEAFCRLFVFKNAESLYLKIGDQVIEENNYATADSTFFQLFDIEMISGDPLKALAEPNGVVLTESAAKKYFGDANPLGQAIYLPLYGEDNYVVTGVCRDVPEYTHFDFDLLFSSADMAYILKRLMYIQHNSYTYFLLREGSDPKAAEAKFPNLVDKYSAGQVEEMYGVAYEDYKNLGNHYGYFLQPLTDIHLHSQLEEELQPNGSAQLLDFLALVAIFILLIACVNYMNLATARAAERAREIGVRKTVGSQKGAIAGQFLTESLVISLLSVLTGGLLALLFLPFFNHLADKNLSFASWSAPVFLLSMLGLAVIVGLLAGSYPAVVLSSFKPVAVLQGRLASTKKGRWFRNGLVVFQFIISIVLIICTLVVFYQQAYVVNKSLGFDKDRLLLLKSVPLNGDKKPAFEEELQKIAQVKCLSRASTYMGGYFYGSSLYKEGARQPIIANGFTAANRFLECMGITILQGRDFLPTFNDSLSIIINETAARELGLSDPVGRRLYTGTTDSKQSLEIVGLAADFNYQSLYNPGKPLAIRFDQFGWTNNYIIRLTTGETTSTIREIEKVWEQFLPTYPFQYSFMDEEWESLHRRGQISKSVFALFAVLAILITCIGLLSLIRYLAQRRAKEIGIRKVFGASQSSIVQLFNREFLKLALIAMLIAFPLAWYFANEWLQSFAYHIDLSWRVFALGGIAAILITFLSVSYEAVKAATGNPVEVLRNE